MTYRKLRSIHPITFSQDIQKSDLVKKPTRPLDETLTLYETVLKELLDKHAPQKSREIVMRPAAPWYTDDIREKKCERRRLERRWRRSRSQSDREVYSSQCQQVNRLLTTTKQNYYN